MGVRCTLFGHAYGDSEIERDREERGDEAVVTIRELQICERCGAETVVSENKEVTSVAEPTDVPPASEPEPAAVPEADVPAADDERALDPETDDGVILEDDEPDDEPGERQYGEWPDAEERPTEDPTGDEETTTGESPAWPDAEGEDDGVDAAAPGEAGADDPTGLAEAERTDRADGDVDATRAGDNDDARRDARDGAHDARGDDVRDADAPSGDARSGSADSTDDAVEDASQIEFFGSDDAEPPGAGGVPRDPPADDRSAADPTPYPDRPEPADGEGDSGMQREGAAPTPSEAGPAASELYCPACDYRDASTDGSLRQGDVCPECKRGYLASRD